MRAANGFVVAASVAVLLMHLYSHGAAGVDRAFACYALGATSIAADVIRGHALWRKEVSSALLQSCVMRVD